MFSIVVFLCAIVTVMLLAFVFYHTFLISQDRTTNEQVKAYQLEGFCKKKLTFLMKWKNARVDKKAFKPTKATIEKYVVNKDISVSIEDE